MPVGAAGGALFDNLPLLFAVGISFGFARKGDGSTALAAAESCVTMSIQERSSSIMAMTVVSASRASTCSHTPVAPKPPID